MTVLKAFEKFLVLIQQFRQKLRRKLEDQWSLFHIKSLCLMSHLKFGVRRLIHWKSKSCHLHLGFRGIIICFRSFRGFGCNLNMNIKIDCLPCTNNGDPKYSSDLMMGETANRMCNCHCVSAGESSLTFSSRNCTDCWEGTTSHGQAKHNWRESMSTELKQNNSYITLVKHTCISF